MALCPVDLSACTPSWYYPSGLCCYRLFTSEITYSTTATATATAAAATTTAIVLNKRGGGGGSHFQSKEPFESET
jgi:hypothetical protein